MKEKNLEVMLFLPQVIPPYPIPSPPVNIPLNDNAFSANVNFDNPSNDGKLFNEH